MNKETAPMKVAVFSVLEEQSKAIDEIYKSDHSNDQSSVPNQFLPAQGSNGSERDADLKHRHGVCKSVMVFHTFTGALAVFLNFLFKLFRCLADFLLLGGISLGFFLCLGG